MLLLDELSMVLAPILVNNAAFGQRADITQTARADWNCLIAVNMTGLFLGCMYLIVKMRESGCGVIINTPSVADLVSVRERAAYWATKGGGHRDDQRHGARSCGGEYPDQCGRVEHHLLTIFREDLRGGSGSGSGS